MKSVFGPWGTRNFERKGMGDFISTWAVTRERSWPAAKKKRARKDGEEYIVVVVVVESTRGFAGKVSFDTANVEGMALEPRSRPVEKTKLLLLLCKEV